MNFCPGSKNLIIGKDCKIWQNYQWIMSLLQSFIDKNLVNVLNQLQVFTRYKKLPMSFNILLTYFIINSDKEKDKKRFNIQKRVIRNRISKDRQMQYNGQRKIAVGQTMIYKTLHRKLKDWETWTPLKTSVELRCLPRQDLWFHIILTFLLTSYIKMLWQWYEWNTIS